MADSVTLPLELALCVHLLAYAMYAEWNTIWHYLERVCRMPVSVTTLLHYSMYRLLSWNSVYQSEKLNRVVC
jgi:hypothetical protein